MCRHSFPAGALPSGAGARPFRRGRRCSFPAGAGAGAGAGALSLQVQAPLPCRRGDYQCRRRCTSQAVVCFRRNLRELTFHTIHPAAATNVTKLGSSLSHILALSPARIYFLGSFWIIICGSSTLPPSSVISHLHGCGYLQLSQRINNDTT